MPKSFDIKQVTIALGAHIVTGLADGTSITVEFDAARYTTEPDAYGKSIRYSNNDYNATITITLNQGSPTNDVLSIFANLDRQSNTGVFSFMIKDNNGTTLISSPGAYVESLPTVAFGTTGNNREWVLKATEVGEHIGGIK